MPSGDTIAALSTGSLPSGIAILRVSGPAAGRILEAAVGPPPEPRRLVLRPIRNTKSQVIDRGMVAWFPSPGTFTGEDCAEFHVHGSPAVVRALMRAFIEGGGARLAEPGEFTRRAFENQRLDWLEVEGLADLLEAETESQRALAIARASGGLSGQVAAWRAMILDLRAAVEAQLDFSDEGDVGELPQGLSEEIRSLAGSLRAAAAQADQGRVMREGFRVALGGPPNAGKSSLLNALARSDVAIVTEEPGTTRDVREVHVDLDGRLVVLVDTAGLRDTVSKAEAEGVRRARQALAEAELVLWLKAPDIANQDPPNGLRVPVWSIGAKSDLGSVSETRLSVSTRTGDNLDTLIRCVGEAVDARLGDGEAILVSRERDRQALLRCADVAEGALVPDLPLELVAEQLRLAGFELERLIGLVDAEAVLGQIFGRFCIGK